MRQVIAGNGARPPAHNTHYVKLAIEPLPEGEAMTYGVITRALQPAPKTQTVPAAPG